MLSYDHWGISGNTLLEAPSTHKCRDMWSIRYNERIVGIREDPCHQGHNIITPATPVMEANAMGFIPCVRHPSFAHIIASVNPLRAKFFRGNINIYFHFVSFLHIDTTQVVEILPQVRQEPTYST